jgi:hypothetical protein
VRLSASISTSLSRDLFLGAGVADFAFRFVLVMAHDSLDMIHVDEGDST